MDNLVDENKINISQEELDLILKEREIWYSKPFVMFEIIKTQHKRELAFINKIDKEYPHRYRFAFIIDIMQKHFVRLDFLKRTYNMYQSVAVLNDMQNLDYGTLTIKELKETPEYQDFHQNYSKKIFGMDIYFDIDGKEDSKKAYEDAKKLKSKLDENKIPYYVLNSSDTGFHFRIPFKYIEDWQNSNYQNIIYNIKGIYRLTTLDDSVVDDKRLCKTPYSFECKSRCVCLPLSDYDFDNWSPEKVRAEYLLKNTIIKNRGLKIRTHSLSEEELKLNVANFIKKFKVI